MPGLLLSIRKVVRLKVTRKEARILHPLVSYLLLSNNLPLFSFDFTESGVWPREIPIGCFASFQDTDQRFHYHGHIMLSCNVI